MKRIWIFLCLAVGIGLGLSALIVHLGGGIPVEDAEGFSIGGWLGMALILALAIFLLLLAWAWAGRSRMLLWMMVLALSLRLILGIVIGLGIPTWGHNNEENNSGYLFLDPYERDKEAWNLAKSGDSILGAAASGFGNDQYGGLLSISAFMYRTFSPDGHRPFLMLIIGAFMAAIGLPFLWVGLQKDWGPKVTSIACWVVALYPEGILQGMTQAREPYIIALLCISLWAVFSWDVRKWQSWTGTILPLGLMAWISLPAAVFSLIFLFIWVILQSYTGKMKKWLQWCLWIAVGMVILLLGLLSWKWFSEAAKWDALEFERGSGFIQMIMDAIGRGWLVPLMTLYGLSQPMLFGALAAKTSAPVFNVIGSFRAAGWYLIAPFFAYGWIRIWKEKAQPKRKLLIWGAIFMTFWILIASMRSGGDQWDNPRYRIIFLPVIALVSAWAWVWARNHKDRWLACILWVDLIFNFTFLFLYIWRYHFQFGINVRPQVMQFSVIGVTAVICVGLIIWTCITTKKDKQRSHEQK